MQDFPLILTRDLWPAIRCFVFLVWAACLPAQLSAADADEVPARAEPYPSPFAVAFSPTGKWLAVSDRGTGSLHLIDTATDKVARTVALSGEATGLAWSEDGARVFVSEYGAAGIAEVEASSGRILRRFGTGLHPMGLAVVAGRGLLLATNQDNNRVAIIDLGSGEESARIATTREPVFVAASHGGTLAAVSNLLPAGDAGEARHAAVIDLLDLKAMKRRGAVRLPPGSSSVRRIVISPDDRWAYVVHTIGRTNMPTTQLDHGWVNTNAFTVIDLAAGKRRATLLLDSPMEGAADPWGLALSADGKTAWISISGTHELARIDVAGLHAFLETRAAEGGDLCELVNDLGALYPAGLITRTAVQGKGPRGLGLSPDGKTLAVGVYFSGTVALVDTATGRVRSSVRLGPAREPDLARRGEILFHDATICFQKWLSCATCHPNNGRVDGLNWDVLSDGIGNPKNVKSLLQAHQTPPMTWRGVRASVEVSTRAGFGFLMHSPEPGEEEAMLAYLRSLKPVPSPFRTPKGGLTESAARGKALFESREVKCASCHEGPLLTDLEIYDVGTRGRLDRAGSFDTPSLVEVYRTAPYLHDGSAASLEELLRRNTEDEHGRTSRLTPLERDDLIAYLKSL